MEKVASKAEVVEDKLITDELLNFKNFMEMKTKLLITGLALIALTTLANAQNAGTGQNTQSTTGRGVAYVDENKDGFCDNFNTARGNYQNGWRMANTSGTTNRRGLAQGQGRGTARGQGRGMGPGQGRGVAPGGRYFVDENKNGICDNRETPAKK
jgi:hypothetical protein